MMAAVGRPALFVVAVVLCCVCGCAAAPDVSVSAQRKEAEVHFLNVEKKKAVLTYLNEAKKKALKVQEAVKEARNEVDGIKNSKEQLTAEVKKASVAAVELNKKMKGYEKLKRENIADVVLSLGEVVPKFEKASNLSNALLMGVAKILSKATEAEKWALESELASSNAAIKANTNVAALAEEASEKAGEVKKLLAQAQAGDQSARVNGAWKEYSRYAAEKAKEALKYAKQKNGVLWNGWSDQDKLNDFVDHAQQSAEKAVEGATKDLNAANKVLELVERAAKSFELWLNKIDIALDAVANPKTESNPLSTSGKPSRLPVPAPEASHGHASHHGEPRSTVPVINPSEKQQTDSVAGSTPVSGRPEPQRPLSDAPDTPKEELHAIPATTVSSVSRSGTGATETSSGTAQGPNAADSGEETEATGINAPESNAHNTLQDIMSADSSVSPSWVRTPLLVVVGGMGLLAVC
ncbi:hypothetical protein DQ04_03611070 [Trypanosoma grayi]|uniref:hypothetical protein n=1 Tax=Trypanosoma grayi TaxID=71804 RepID=UPI0004F4636E|nr:hypothetical protein DQ04_03611070 [Trypanosoma grayi]KEG10532.1 hypothetical protein DQ04_03611070 [Trypanosoma grayi]